MEALLSITQTLHALLGALCILTGLVALLTPKRSGAHPRAGRAFVWILAGLYLAILPSILEKANAFMLVIGWMALSAGLEGRRALLRSQARLSPELQTFDRVLAGLGSVLGVGLLIFAGALLIRDGSAMGVVMGLFGLLSLALGQATLKRGKHPPSKDGWLAVHIQLMTGSFSAALTAFFVLQLEGLLGQYDWVLWVAPVVLMNAAASWQLKSRGLSRG